MLPHSIIISSSLVQFIEIIFLMFPKRVKIYNWKESQKTKEVERCNKKRRIQGGTAYTATAI